MSRRHALAALIATAVACSSYGSEDGAPPPPARDAGTDAASPIDDASTTDANAGVDAGDAGPAKCDRAKPFGAPIAVPGLTSNEYEGGAQLTADELHVFWARFDTEWAIWTASRQTKGDPFSGAVKLATVNDPAPDLDPSPTGDGLSLYFSSERDGGADIYKATRASTIVAFEPPVKVVEASGSSSDRRPFVAPDGMSLWFDSSRSGASRVYRLNLSSIGVGTPEIVDLGAPNSGAHDEHPVISSDGLALYFGARGREDAETHVYMATRSSAGAKFGMPARVVGWPGFAAPTWITADECRLYVSIGGSNIAGTRIYMVQRQK